jgi:DNA-binding PadR family transcriptional regulator
MEVKHLVACEPLRDGWADSRRPLNDGQVYTTLARLERDGLVEAEAEADGQRVYRLTGAGRQELDGWFLGPVGRDVVPRQELAIKLIFAARSRTADVHQVIQRQRAATVRTMQELTRLKHDREPGSDLPWILTLDSLLFQAEAEVRWLDHCEASIARYSPPPVDLPRAADETATEASRR